MKKVFLVQAPVNTISGYGAHSRDIVKSLMHALNLDEWEIIINPTRWGDTPQMALNPDLPEDKKMLDLFIKGPIHKQPEVFMQITVPNEFQQLGKFNIGVTAGIETTIASQVWMDGLNRMDLIIVPSKHAKDVFVNTKWSQVNQQTKAVERIITCQKPIEVLFEGIDELIYKKINDTAKLNSTILDEFKQSFVTDQFLFLYVGHWIKGEFGHDRKDVATLIKSFLEAFVTEDKKPGLVLKTSSAGFSILDRDQMLNNINSIKLQVAREYRVSEKDLPNIYLLHGNLTDEEINSLYNYYKIKAFVTFTKGEGYGRPLAEFSVTGKPIIASGWSGHLDFLHPDHTILLPGKLEKIHKSAVWENVLIPESSWFYVDYNASKNVFKDVAKNYQKHKTRSEGQADYIKEFTFDKMTDKLKSILDASLPKFAMPIELKLPPLPKKEN